MKKVPIAVEEFKKIIEENYYYIDKTKFIEDVLNDGAEVKLFCRPRRFGKTLNMSTLKYFFDIENKDENRKLFNGLYIENSPLIDEQGKYPVIFLSMKGISSAKFEDALDKIKDKISNLYINYSFLMETLNDEYSQSFGLVEDEVKTMLDYYKIGYEMLEVKKWYDGYSFGKSDIYNPWSILNFVQFKELKSYWINTSSNFMIRELLEHTGEEGLKTLERIFNQEEVAIRITENVRFGNNLSASEVWELMLYSGYLTINGKLDDGRYLVRIPNIEITNFFKDEFLTIVFGNYDKVDKLRDALRDKNIEQLNKSIEELVLYTMSSHDITKYYENPYHMLLLGFFYALDG